MCNSICLSYSKNQLCRSARALALKFDDECLWKTLFWNLIVWSIPDELIFSNSVAEILRICSNYCFKMSMTSVLTFLVISKLIVFLYWWFWLLKVFWICGHPFFRRACIFVKVVVTNTRCEKLSKLCIFLVNLCDKKVLNFRLISNWQDKNIVLCRMFFEAVFWETTLLSTILHPPTEFRSGVLVVSLGRKWITVCVDYSYAASRFETHFLFSFVDWTQMSFCFFDFVMLSFRFCGVRKLKCLSGDETLQHLHLAKDDSVNHLKI